MSCIHLKFSKKCKHKDHSWTHINKLMCKCIYIFTWALEVKHSIRLYYKIYHKNIYQGCRLQKRHNRLIRAYHQSNIWTESSHQFIIVNTINFPFFCVLFFFYCPYFFPLGWRGLKQGTSIREVRPIILEVPEWHNLLEISKKRSETRKIKMAS